MIVLSREPLCMNFSRLDHVALVARDAARTRDWYCETLGMEWVFRGQWNNRPYFVRKGTAQLAIFQAKESTPNRTNVGLRADHFAFLAETRADYDAIKAELTENGIPFDESDHDVAWSIYLTDPDGQTVEFTTYDR